MKIKTKATAIDLFCGAGGLTHGLLKAGVPVNAGIDIDASCEYSYERNNASKFFNKSVKDVTGAELRALYPSEGIKVLVGCAPCQTFSKHTQKNKQRRKDEKWGLLYQFSRLISELAPEIVSMENVPGIAKYKVFSDFVRTLKSSGYHVSWEKVFCPKYGIPQNRRRLILLASKLGKITLIPPTHTPDNFVTVQDVIGGLEALPAGTASAEDPLHRAAALSALNLKRIQASVQGGTWNDWDKDLLAKCHKRKTGKTYTTVYSRMSWKKPAPTITTQFYVFGTGRFGHPTQDRAISLREGALLQTFPKTYAFFEGDSIQSMREMGIHIGNAVPVRLGEIIGESILRHLGEHDGSQI